MSIPLFNYRKPKTVEKKGNKIIVFANQKGGVGKSTNGILFANFLTDKGVRLAMIDADPQQSIKFKHEEDLVRFPEFKALYPVTPFLNLDNEEKTQALLTDMRRQEYDFIVDTPGNLSLQGMVPLLLEADIIIAPFQYEETCLESLNSFVNLNINVNNNAGRDKITPMIFLPNMHHKTWGTKQEIEVDKETERNLRSIGLVSPKVPSSPEMRRYTSVYTTKPQRELTAPCYDFLYANIYND